MESMGYNDGKIGGGDWRQAFDRYNKNSDGYGLYSPTGLDDFHTEDYEDIGTCAHERYPEGYYYKVTQDSIYLKDIRPSFNLR